ncbi:hypothetical protein B7486_48150 [cyanobacterium TDX16]|nr:hypothetical protein B7486_48150 [cyanobacterium TDX16]
MLTIDTINPQQGEQYYQQENHYPQDTALKNSEWWGCGATQLRLSSQIQNDAAYKNLLNGLSPNEQQKLRGKPKQVKDRSKKQPKERAGVDMCFAAPKSVSIACLVGGDRRLEVAHRHAIKRTLAFAEQLFSETRVKGERVKTGNLTVAIWHHDTSRELDPHLHSHCIVMNVTQLPSGKWQSRADEILYQNKMLLGRIYRNELALECQKLGYEIEPHPKELFEIQGYTREQIEAFSKRYQQILEKLAESGKDVTAENKVWAWRRTRIRKRHALDLDQMLPFWQQEAHLYGIAHPVCTEQQQVTSAQQIQAQIQKAVSDGIEHCAERQVAFKIEEIVKFVMAEIRQFDTGRLLEAIASHPDLIQIGDKQGRVTTQTAFLRELATIKLMQHSQGQVESITYPEVVEKCLEATKLNWGQRQAILLAATTTDRFIAWQGVAGAGKTFALNQLKQVIDTLPQLTQDRSYLIKGFAPSAEAANVLGQEMGIEAQTVAKVLVSKPPDRPQQNQIWIVDEAGLLGAKDGYELLKRAIAEQARVILVGDTRQLSSVAAGSPFRSLQQAGIGTAYLNESMRQRDNSPDLKQAVSLAAQGDSAAAISHLVQVGRVEQIADADERANRIAFDYLQLDSTQRNETVILAGTKKECATITQRIRQLLKQEGSLGYAVEATKLTTKDLTQVQARYTHYYKVGDVVVPVREYKRKSLHKFQSYAVEAIDKDKLKLKDTDGNTLIVDPIKFRKAVYTQEKIEIAVGHRLRWKKNQHQLGRRNGQEFTVLAIDGDTASIQYKDSSTEKISIIKPLHVEYAYLLTTYAAQGKTAEKTLVSAAKDRSMTKESAYVAMSRARSELTIYAQDKQQLLEAARHTGVKENPIELFQHNWGRVPVELLAVGSSTEQFLVQSTKDNFLENKVLSGSRELSPEQSSINSQDEVSNTNCSEPVIKHKQVALAPTENLTSASGDLVARDKRESLAALAERLREIPLEDIAASLGLEPDRHDKHKWKDAGLIVSINNQKFFDHAVQKGGYGAIDLVMHVQQRDFRGAVDWLSNGASIELLQERSPRQTVRVKSKSFQLPVADGSKWAAVRQYLTQKRHLLPTLVDELHQQGIVYADGKQNAVFVRKSIDGVLTGASLRGTYNDSKFKGLATGSRREGGWFSFVRGEGELKRIVIVESAIDAMSAAALAQQPGKTMFLSTDGAGSLPMSWLKQQQGVQVIVAHDADRAGEEMAWKVALELPAVTRAIPSGGKDWNEQLLGDRFSLPHATFPDFSQWKQVAQALGRTDTHVDWVVSVTEVKTAQQPLPETVISAMQQDFNDYKQISRQLWQWHRAAKTLNETDAYLKRIAEVGIAFHHHIQPSPLSAKTLATMQQDREKLAYMFRYRELLQKVCKSSAFAISPTGEIDVAVALVAYKESSDSKEIGRIIAQSDRVKVWKKSMSETEFCFKATEYVREVCDRALKLHSIEQQQKPQLDRAKKCSQDMEL